MGVGGRVFSPKRPIIGRANSVLCAFLLYFFRGGLSLRLSAQVGVAPPKWLKLSDSPTHTMPIYAYVFEGGAGQGPSKLANL